MRLAVVKSFVIFSLFLFGIGHTRALSQEFRGNPHSGE